MRSTHFPGKVIVDELVVTNEITTEDGTTCPGVVVKAAAPTTANKFPVGTLWVKTDASAPEVHMCVALTASAATWKKLTLET